MGLVRGCESNGKRERENIVVNQYCGLCYQGNINVLQWQEPDPPYVILKIYKKWDLEKSEVPASLPVCHLPSLNQRYEFPKCHNFLLVIAVSHALTAVLCCIAQHVPVPSGSCPMLKSKENLLLDVLAINLTHNPNAAKGPRSEQQVPLPLKAEAEVLHLLYQQFHDYSAPSMIIWLKNNWAGG